MDITRLIIDEATRLEDPDHCHQCDRLTEHAHHGDYGLTCVDCCLTRHEWAVRTTNTRGVPFAYIGGQFLGALRVPFLSPAVDEEILRLIDEVAA